MPTLTNRLFGMKGEMVGGEKSSLSLPLPPLPLPPLPPPPLSKACSSFSLPRSNV